MAQNTGSWSIVPNVLQDILTEKRAAQHQKLIDSLNLVQQQSAMENAAKEQQRQLDEAAATAEYRKGTLAEQAADRLSREKIAGMRPAAGRPSIIEEYEYAKANGYPGSFVQYQTEDANRKKVNPPQGPAPSFQLAGTDPTTGKPMVMDARTGQFRIADSGPIGPKPSAGSGKGPSPAEFINLSKLAGKAASTPGKLWGTTPAKPQDVAAYNQALNSIVARYNAPKEIVEGVLRAIDEYPEPDIPSAQIIELQKQSGATPEELAKFAELLTIARGR